MDDMTEDEMAIKDIQGRSYDCKIASRRARSNTSRVIIDDRPARNRATLN